jgi:(p)ppGpp synthase/HD superfamily hydrolase
MDINHAYTLAKYVHRAQKRKEIGADGLPMRYFEHPRRVALILMDTVGILDPVILCAALLHDTVEDSEELPPAAIERYWGSEVAALVQILSKVPYEGYLDRLLRYGDWRALLIKSADRLDNLRSLRVGEVTVEFRDRQIEETRVKYMPLFERMVTLVPEAVSAGARAVLGEIRTLIA